MLIRRLSSGMLFHQATLMYGTEVEALKVRNKQLESEHSRRLQTARESVQRYYHEADIILKRLNDMLPTVCSYVQEHYIVLILFSCHYIPTAQHSLQLYNCMIMIRSWFNIHRLNEIMEAGVGLVPPAPKKYNMIDRLRRIQELLTPSFKDVPIIHVRVHRLTDEGFAIDY